MQNLVTKEITGRIVINDEGKAWGKIYGDYEGWVDIQDLDDQSISMPNDGKYYLNKPSDKTYEGSPYTETLSKGKIVEIKRTIITELKEI